MHSAIDAPQSAPIPQRVPINPPGIPKPIAATVAMTFPIKIESTNKVLD